jgi:hypothetical protein
MASERKGYIVRNGESVLSVQGHGGKNNGDVC